MNVQELCWRYAEWKDICTSVKLGSGIGLCGGDMQWVDRITDTVYSWQLLGLYVRIIEEACETDDILLAITEDIPPEMLGLSKDIIERAYQTIESKLKQVL